MSAAAPTRALLAVLPLSLATIGYFSLASPPEPREGIEWLTVETAAARGATRPRLLHFTADWCGPCREMRRTTFRDRNLANFVNERFVPVRFEERKRIKSSEMEDAMRRYGVDSFPTLVVLDAEGRVKARIEGLRPPENLRHELEQALGRPNVARVEWCGPDSPVLKEQDLPRVYFFSDGYGTTLSDSIERAFRSPQLAAEFAGQFLFVEVPTWYRPHTIYNRFAVNAIPTIVVVDSDEVQLARLVGVATQEEVRALLAASLAARTEAPARPHDKAPDRPARQVRGR